jgi:hypothetical protein
VTTARQIGLFGGAVLALAVAIGLQAGRNAAYPVRQRASEGLLYTRSGPALKRMALEFDALASDVYWIRALQHYGGDRLSRDGRRKYELLQPLLDLTTTLDPYFTIAYRFGAIFLSEEAPGGPGRPDAAIALLQKGIAAEPQKWQYFHDIAFVHYWNLHDPVTAASWFQRAGAMPGAPNWLAPVAASMLSARDRTSARFLWEQILRSDQPWLRQTAERSLLQLEALDQIDELQRLVRKAPIPAGQRVTWADLVRRRILAGIPLDPVGTPYALDPDTGTVTLGPESSLKPLPDLDHPIRQAPVTPQ